MRADEGHHMCPVDEQKVMKEVGMENRVFSPPHSKITTLTSVFSHYIAGWAMRESKEFRAVDEKE